MRIIKNQSIIQNSTKALEAYELSNIAMVLNTPTFFVTWYDIDPDLSETVKGTRNIDDYIGPQSTLVFDKIERLPVYGIENLINFSQFDEEVGFDEDFQSSAVVYPNTIFPKPGSFFVVETVTPLMIFAVTDVRPSTIKSNPFIEFNFRLFSRDPERVKQLDRQVHEEYVVSLSAIGKSKSLVIKKSSSESLDYHLNAYLEICYLYIMLFYDRAKAAFVIDGFPDSETGWRRRTYIDMVLWKFMFDSGVIIYDDLVTYANNNSDRTVERVYTSCPDVYVDEYKFRRSIIWRIMEKDDTPAVRRSSFDHYRFPHLWEPTSRITKYQGQDIWYMDEYLDHPSKDDTYGDFAIWDDDFICRIRHNDPYDESGLCEDKNINPYLRNTIIRYYNDETIDWDSIQISDVRNVENYYLIPLVLKIYQKYIQGLV